MAPRLLALNSQSVPERLLAPIFVLALVAISSVARADDDVAVSVSGPDAEPVAEAFAGLVTVADDRRLIDAAPTLVATLESDDELAFVVSIDTDEDVARVFRRADGARFERRFEATAEDSYAFALVAAELLEVARTGADPVEVGLAAAESGS